MSERLQVVYGDQVVATLERLEGNRLELVYTPHAIELAQGQVLLSASLPVRAEPYSQERLLPFFEGLLPEADVRNRMAQRLQLDSGDVFGILREIGRDCAGAFSIVPDGYDLAAGREEGVDWLSDQDLATKVRELEARPLGVEPDRDIRISLAGAQDKMAVVYDGSRMGMPRGTTPSTHILKPASRVEIPGAKRKPAFPGLVANEGFCMTLAGMAGLTVARVEVFEIDEQPALLIERYDRRRTAAGEFVRLHQEDFSQALGISSHAKYEKDNGPGSAAYLKLVLRNSTDTLTDLPELVDRMAFNYAIGNADGHAKNFSLLYRDESSRLAPGYDLISTYVYGHLSYNMATAINGIYDSRAIRPIHWQKELVRLELDQGMYGTRLAALADRVADNLSQAIDWVGRNGLADQRVDEIAELVGQRVAVLHGVRELPVRIPRRTGRSNHDDPC